LEPGKDDDPVKLLARAIEWTPGETVQLFSGFRGTGKSTELRRLRKHLKDEGYLVVLCDMQDYLNLSMPVDITDFLMAVAVHSERGWLAKGGSLGLRPMKAIGCALRVF